MSEEITLSTLLNDLRRLGIERGDRLGVHTSYRAIGRVEGGPGTVIRALMEVVTEAGTLVMPTFQDNPHKVFRRRETPSECGIITELFRKMPHVYRSLHPTHSTAAWGERAEWIASAHEQGRTALGVDSPFDRLAQIGGKVLLIGVGFNRCSLVHVAEAYSNMPYLPVPYCETFAVPVAVEADDGQIRHVLIEECPGCSENFEVLGDRMRAAGVVRTGAVGNAPAQIFSGNALIQVARQMLQQNPAALLCSNPACPFCPQARIALGQP